MLLRLSPLASSGLPSSAGGLRRIQSKKSAETSRINTLVNNVRLMMKNMKCSLEDALNALEISGNERTLITKQIQK